MKNLTPIKAIRSRCKDCSETPEEIKNCPCFENNGSIEKCPLWPYRMGHRPTEEEKEKFGKYLTPIKSIRKYCLWCCGGSRKLVRECPVKDCPLWKYRFGKNPNLKGKRVNNLKKIPCFSQKTQVDERFFNEKFLSNTNLSEEKINGKKITKH